MNVNCLSSLSSAEKYCCGQLTVLKDTRLKVEWYCSQQSAVRYVVLVLQSEKAGEVSLCFNAPLALHQVQHVCVAVNTAELADTCVGYPTVTHWKRTPLTSACSTPGQLRRGCWSCCLWQLQHSLCSQCSSWNSCSTTSSCTCSSAGRSSHSSKEGLHEQLQPTSGRWPHPRPDWGLRQPNTTHSSGTARTTRSSCSRSW